MKVGDYVRTKGKTFQPPQIAKIRSMKKDSGYKNQYFIELDHNLLCEFEFEVYEEDIDKSSPNIIDLIEEDDFINQTRVSEIIKKAKDSIRFMADSDYEFSTELKEKEIKSVITKEQFESMEYKL